MDHVAQVIVASSLRIKPQNEKEGSETCARGVEMVKVPPLSQWTTKTQSRSG